MTAPTTSRIPSEELRLALDQLFALQTFGLKLGLDQTLALLHRIGNPHLSFPSVHVAGTNGKGSVCAMIASVLQAAGLRVGLFSSPHLLRFNERIRLNGIPISDDRLIGYTRRMMPDILELGCTFFEGTTAMAFRYFADEKVDVAVIETGLGGRLDSTNVLTPLLSVITSIGLDHTKHLGETLELIAAEKAGIIKPGVPATVGDVAPRLRKVFADKAAEAGDVRLVFAADACHCICHSTSFDGMNASFLLNGRELPRLELDLAGGHQLDNARTTLAALDLLRDRLPVNDDALRTGMSSVTRSTGLRGRFETIRKHPARIIVDVAHNPDGARALAETLTKITGKRPVAGIVYGSVKDKDVAGVLERLAPHTRTLYAVRAESHRALEPPEIAHFSVSAGIPTIPCTDVASGIARAIADSGPDGIVLVCGSFFVAGEALRYLETGEGGAGELDRVHEALNDYRTDDTTQKKRLTVREWSSGEQPRERLMRHGARTLSDAELLAILLRTGTRQRDVVQLARDLVNAFESLSGLASRDPAELKQTHGIGPTKAATLAAAFELASRLQSDPFDSLPQIGGPEDVARIFIPRLRGARKEEFHIVMLSTANRIIGTRRVSEGNLNSSIVHPREVFRHAVIESAAAIIGLHNHPSGNPKPSQEDIAITRQLSEAGKLLGIPLHDHIIIAGETFVSLAGEGII